MQTVFNLGAAEISRDISNFTAGSASLSAKDNVEGCNVPGSGSPVTVGQEILTACKTSLFHAIDWYNCHLTAE